MREQLLEALREHTKALPAQSLQAVIEYARALSIQKVGRDKLILEKNPSGKIT